MTRISGGADLQAHVSNNHLHRTMPVVANLSSHPGMTLIFVDEPSKVKSSQSEYIFTEVQAVSLLTKVSAKTA